MVVNAVGKFLYRGVFSRASTSVLGVIVGAFFLERSCAEIADYVFDNANKGKQWKDIKHLYENK
ncbi:Ras [Tyrophagus putrescentiae]|nr:Ras [Tyrophagus putrescentiae]